MRSDIKISRENRKEIIEILKNYFEKERDEELGDLAAGLIADFIAKEIAPIYYNQGIMDAYDFIIDKSEDLLGLQRA